MVSAVPTGAALEGSFPFTRAYAVLRLLRTLLSDGRYRLSFDSGSNWSEDTRRGTTGRRDTDRPGSATSSADDSGVAPHHWWLHSRTDDEQFVFADESAKPVLCHVQRLSDWLFVSTEPMARPASAGTTSPREQSLPVRERRPVVRAVLYG